MAAFNYGFDDRLAVNGIIERGGEIMDYFISTDTMRRCPLIPPMKRKKEKSSTNQRHGVKLLGSGAYGSVYSVKLNIDGTERTYAIKKSKNTVYKTVQMLWREDDATLRTIGEKFEPLFPRHTLPLFYTLNGGDPDRVIGKGGYFYAAIYNEGIKQNFSGGCRLRHPERIIMRVINHEIVPDPDKQGMMVHHIIPHKNGSLYHYLVEEGKPIPIETAFIPFQVPSSNGKVTNHLVPRSQQAYFIHKVVPAGDSFVYEAGDYLCSDETAVEYPISVLCSTLVERGICVNFLDVFGFSMCVDRTDKGDRIPVGIFDYTFLEMVDGSIDDIMTTRPGGFPGKMIATEALVDTFYIQIVFAISAMQRNFGIQHNDLHTGNVLGLLLKNKRDFIFGGKDLTKVEWFRYEIDGRMVYLKNEGVIAKIGDFGLAAKFSSPRLSMRKRPKNLIPNWRDDSYDFLYFTMTMFHHYGRISRLVSNMLCLIFRPYHRYVNSVEGAFNLATGYYKSDGHKLFIENRRPRMIPLDRKPWEFITDNSVMGKYLSKPVGYSEKDIATIGKLRSDQIYEGYYAPEESNNTSIPKVKSKRLRIPSPEESSKISTPKVKSKRLRVPSPEKSKSPLEMKMYHSGNLPEHLKLNDDE